MKDYYKVLEVDSKATFEQIHSQHRLLIHAWHPDKFPNDKLRDKAEERTKEINEAYSVIGNTAKREIFDRDLDLNDHPSQTDIPKSKIPSIKIKSRSTCDNCGMPAQLNYVEFYENVGMLFSRRYRAVKGNFCKSCIDYYFWNFSGKTMILGWWGAISFIVTPFILLNNLIRFIFTVSMIKRKIRRVQNPSPFLVISTVSGFLFIGYVLFFTIFPTSTMHQKTTSIPSSTKLSPTQNPIPSPAQLPTQRPLPTEFRITFNGIPCIPWASVDNSYIGNRICVYGKVFSYSPPIEKNNYLSGWNNIQFSSKPASFQMIQYNGYYLVPIEIGDCVAIFGRIRDNGSYLIIAPGVEESKSVMIFKMSSVCDQK